MARALPLWRPTTYPVLGFCLAECVDHRVFESALDLSEVDLPATYEN